MLEIPHQTVEHSGETVGGHQQQIGSNRFLHFEASFEASLGRIATDMQLDLGFDSAQIRSMTNPWSVAFSLDF